MDQETSAGQKLGAGSDLMTKERWGMVSEHLQTKEREARNSKDRGGRMSGGKQS